MIQPVQSPEINLIEHLWDCLKKKIKARYPKNIKELKLIINEEWYAIDPEFCKKLVSGMHKRAFDLYLARGGHTSY